MATKSSFYSNTGTTTNNIDSITSLNNEATASKDAAAVSATNAATSATASEVSNAAALVSKNAAATSETTASGHKDTATTQAALATTNGAAQVTLATAQVALATTQAGLATTNGAAQVTLATAQVALGTTQANTATTKASEASTSASSATSSASTATTKASEAAASAASAAASLDLFTDQYLGSKSSAPTVDNDGDALTSGDLYYDSTASELRYYNGSAWVSAYISAAGMASLSGATFTGDVTVPNLITAGNVDGRDVSVDGIKLDTIETSATADQTNAEIRAAVEAATDSNAFTDADHTKLNAIAASANNYVHPNHSGDVVSTADGATVIQVDAVDIPMLSATGTASATTFLRGDNAWVTPTDTNTTYSVGDGGLTQINFTSANNIKLGAIEASADVTDATNVTAAGALMKTGGAMTGALTVTGARSFFSAASENFAVGARYVSTGGAVYFGATDATSTPGVQISAATGAALLNITTAGNVGIGTTSPDYLLDVENSSGNSMMRLHSGTNGSSSIRLQNDAQHWDLNLQTNDRFALYDHTAGTQPFTVLPTSGNVGIGTSSPATKLDVAGTVTADGLTMGAGNEIKLGTSAEMGLFNSSGTSHIRINSGTFKIRADDMRFTAQNGTTERMRIDSSGRLLLNTTTAGGVGYSLYPQTNGALIIQNQNYGNGFTHNLFQYNGTTAGAIVGNTSSTAYNTSSDYRLKENVDYTWDATTRLKQLKPARFNFIVDETNTPVDGFLAHEVSSIVPEAITGAKDAMRDEEYEVTPAVEEVRDADDNITTEAVEAVMGTRSVPDMQGIDQSKLVPLLVKAMQEQQATIEALEARLTALET